MLEEKQGLPYALYVRAGLDGSGTLVAVDRIITGLRWKAIQPPVLCHGNYQLEFIDQIEQLGLRMSASLDAGIV